MSQKNMTTQGIILNITLKPVLNISNFLKIKTISSAKQLPFQN